MGKKAAADPARTKLTRLLERCRTSGLHFDEALIGETGSAEAAQALVWRAVGCDAVPVGELHVRRFLLEHAMSAEGPAVLAAQLARLPPPEDGTELLAGWPRDVDALVFRAMILDAPALAEVEARCDDRVRLGLSFVRWRRGEVVPPDHAERIVTEHARSTARGHVLGSYDPTLPALDDRGVEVRLAVRTLDDVRALAGRLAPDGELRFDEALAEATRENAWATIADVEPALRRMPRAELVAQLAVRTEYTPRPGVYAIVGSTTYRMDEALALLDTRLAAGTDSPAALFAEARHLTEVGRRRSAGLDGDDAEPGDPALLAMVVVVAAARRAGGEVPADLEEVVAFGRAAAHPPLLDALVEALRTLPAARVHGWLDRVLDRDPAAIAALAAHPDATRLRDVLNGFTPLVVEALAVLGPPALPTLLEVMNGLPAERAARVRHGFVFALAAATAEGQPPPEDLDLELLVAAFDGRPMEREPYASALRAATERIVNAMPASRRTDLLNAAYTTAPMSVVAMLHSIVDDDELTTLLGTAVVDGMVTEWLLRGLGSRAVPALLAWGGRSKRAGWVRDEAQRALAPSDFAQVAHLFVDGERWRAIEKDVAAANALDPTAPRIRVYLLEEASAATPARAGSLSRLGGRAGGLSAARVPKDDDGEPLVHILTIDVDDAPELRARYPEAAAIALFTPAPREGGRAEDSALVALPRAKGGKAGTGRALAVFGIDVPRAVFDEAADEPALRAVRDRIVHAGGHLFGRPSWLQGKPFDGDDGDGFVMQIDDGLSDELNLGDGSLYVYESAIIVQSL